MKPIDILVAGEINPDLVLSGASEPAFGQVEKLVESAVLTIGSSSAIFACGAARLGLKVAFIGLCGDDIFGRFMLDEMRRRLVNVDLVMVLPGGSTGLSVILNRGADRAILTHPGLMQSLKAEDVSDSLLGQARHLHVASYYLQTGLHPGLPDLFHRARSLGLTTSLDPNYDPAEQWLGIHELLEATDVFLPNDVEASSLSGASTVDAAAELLALKVASLAIKLGASGALGIEGGQKVMIPSLPVEVVDTVGAGDSFDAGFLYGYLHGWGLDKSLGLAVACGALSTRAAGGVSAQPTLEEALVNLPFNRYNNS